MTDTRPSENTDEIPQWPGFRAAGFFDNDPEPEPTDPIADFIERATNAHDPALGLVFAQLATVQQLRKLTEVAEAAVDTVRGLLAEGVDR